MIPVLRDGNVITNDPISSTKPLFFKDELDSVLTGSCSSDGSRSGVLSTRSGLTVRSISQESQGDDILLLSGINEPHSLSIDSSTG